LDIHHPGHEIMTLRYARYLFLVMLIELCIGGGGRFMAFGPISLRMILFGIALVMAIALLIAGQKIRPVYWQFLIFFVFVILVGIGVGLFHKNPSPLIAEDVKPLCYFLILPFFALVVGDREIEETISIIKGGSLFLATGFILFLLLIHSGVFPFLSLYKVTEKSGELFYRGELTFFYKAFLFLGIGAIFFLVIGSSTTRYFMVAFLILTMILSATRGLVLALALTLAAHYLFQKKILQTITYGLLAAVVFFWGGTLIAESSRWIDSAKNEKKYSETSPVLLGARDFSDRGRIGQAQEVFSMISFPSAMIGHGFGAGTPLRPVHMEISYLEIFHKQGLLGLGFWTFLFGYMVRSFLLIRNQPVAQAFFFGALFIFIESMTNQYINNPIGLSMLLLFTVCLDKLKTIA
jgi:hypothetical protein